MNNQLTCLCPQQCTKSDQCGQDAICYFYDGNCGGGATGYCQPRAAVSQWTCGQNPACGCDGNLYDNACAAILARVSPSAAPTSDCAAEPVRCSDSPPVSSPPASCYPSQYCMAWNNSGPISPALPISESCATFPSSCAQPSCDCLSYNAATCSCALLPSGIVKLICMLAP